MQCRPIPKAEAKPRGIIHLIEAANDRQQFELRKEKLPKANIITYAKTAPIGNAPQTANATGVLYVP
ncbi:hypothetical protein SAMN05444141_112107 [Pseudovibrio denitrificans]|uniref:Uncharacterized protein n=1 Tax=Pseudovibrio denitrificans TaxID=258256 RepID=A0A1I7DXX0_9HYPH|nr:hypothetical protein SAMN05444141_112107 [Pseudovibrio denitrificans]